MAAQAATQASSLSGEDLIVRDAFEKHPVIYILASRPNGTLYVGVTSNLFDRMLKHINGTFDGFTKKYNVKQLVYYEAHADMAEAIKRESQIKKWRRLWKIRLIENMNPTWTSLFDESVGILAAGPSGLDQAEMIDRIQ
jgi:putative endonuclease